ncbi:DUF1396 domain-containing protein [Streptomyces sp. NPDC018031]|uniref:DUF1396 domain-containing protein n=1 Tax=Streptomyces sp. NPDC018031 TaxID=3365033 RepID=UPI0037B78B78
MAALLLAGAAGCGSAESGAAAGGGTGPTTKAAARPGSADLLAVREAARKSGGSEAFHYRATGRTPNDAAFDIEQAVSARKPAPMWLKNHEPDPARHEPVEVRLVGGALYADTGSREVSGMRGKRWLKTDLATVERYSGRKLDVDALTSMGGQDTGGQLTSITDSEDVRRVGTGTVAGIRTTHYRGTVGFGTMREKLRNADPETRTRREARLRSYERAGVHRLVMDLWVDEDNRVKRYRVRGDGPRSPFDVTVTYLSLGEPVTVRVPPAGDTVDAAELTD